jgi:hypothetical protein
MFSISETGNLNIKLNLFQIHFQTIQMVVTAGIFLASILLKEMRYLVYTV